MTIRSCIWHVQIFFTVDCTVYKVKFEIGDMDE